MDETGWGLEDGALYKVIAAATDGFCSLLEAVRHAAALAKIYNA